MKISVILVNYNGLPYNDLCIRSIMDSEWRGELHVYVVDNGSSDGSMEELERTWNMDMRVTLLYLGDNRGFAAANNVGLRRALEDGTDYLLFLNNDTCIEKKMLTELVRAERKYGMCITIPKIYYYDNPDTIWSAGGGFTKIVQKPISFGENQKDSSLYDIERKCTNGNGCCMLLSRSVLEKIGLWEEDFFLYYEDTEYFMRAKEQGIGVVYVPTAKMYHKVNGSTKGNDNPACVYYITRNWLMCYRKHLHGGNYLIFWIYFMLNRCAWMSIWLLQRKGERIRALGKGIGDFYRGKNGKYIE